MACLISIITQSLIYPCFISCLRGSRSIVDGETLEWEETKCFQEMTEDEVKSMSVKDSERLPGIREKRMENNAWGVAKKVKERIHDAPVLIEYITAYLTMKPQDQFFFNPANILAFNKAKSDTLREQIPGSGHRNKISTFIESHYNVVSSIWSFSRGM